MEVLKLAYIGIEECVLRAAAILRAGGVILYPTDTLYGLGADALSDQAVAKIKRIKGRNEKKPIHAIVADATMAEKYALINDEVRLLAQKFWPGALTLILEKRELNTGIARDMDTFAVRVPDNEFCLALAREFGPYTTTSANRSGEVSPRSVEKILMQLGEAVSNIDLIIDAGELPERSPSTVVDARPGRLVVLREGTIPAADVWNALRVEL